MVKSPEGSQHMIYPVFRCCYGDALYLAPSKFQRHLRGIFELQRLKLLKARRCQRIPMSLSLGDRRPWPVAAALDGKTSPFGAVLQQPHGHRLRAQSAHAARKVTRCLVMSKRNRHRQPFWIVENVVNQRFLHLP